MLSKWTIYGLFFNVLAFSSLLANNLKAQGVKSVKETFIYVSSSNLTLGDLLTEIEYKTDYNFSYNKEDLDASLPIKMRSRRASVADLLLEISKKAELKFRQVNNSIHIKPKENYKKEQYLEILVQQTTVSGKVTSEGGEALVGVNVLLKGTSVGTITDVSGAYSIEVPNDAILVFSYVGYKSMEVEVGSRSVIDVQLQPDFASLEEIVVVGYGTVKKSDLTGSVSSIKGEEIKEYPITSLDQGIQGRAPGVYVSQNSSAPGGGISVKIRGNNSINMSTEPLYVIDGFPVVPDNDAFGVGGNRRPTNILATLNPLDIESIEVLKDASATAIYGSRGANGVVLITTKKGKQGKTLVEYSGSVSAQEIANKIEVLNAEEYAEYQNLRAQSRNIAIPYPDPSQFRGTGVNWQDEILQTGMLHNHQLTVSGGNEKSNYLFSFGLHDNKGIIRTSGFKRYSLRTNLGSKAFNDRVTITSTNTFSRTVTDGVITDRGGPGGLIITAIGGEPFGPVKDAEGNYVKFLYDGRFLINPVAELEDAIDQDKGNRFLSNNAVEVDLIKGLSFKTSLGFDIYNLNRYSYYGLDTRIGSPTENNVEITEVSRFLVNLLNENILNYQTRIGRNSINALVGYTYQTEDNRQFWASNTDYFADNPDANMLGTGASPRTPGSERLQWDLVSYIARINYSYNDKYLLTATFRRDGSSKFGENNKWANFPSFAAGWRLIEEPFIDNLNVFSNLKIRASYGVTGNSNIRLYQSQARLGTGIYSFNGNFVEATYIERIANPDLKWETNKQLNIGLDLGFMQDRISLTADYFKNRIDDLLFDVSLPSSVGFSSAFLNAGSIENRGLELSLGIIAIDNENLTWSVNTNFSRIRNEILDLGKSAPFHGTSVSGHQGIRGAWIDEGLPVGVWKGLKAIGIWQSDEEIQSNPHFSFDKPGYVRYADMDNDGDLDSDDEVIVGDPNPDFTWGFTTDLNYKNFDLSIFLRGVHGKDIRNAQAAEHADGVGNYNQIAIAYRDAWSPSNPDGTRPIVDAQREFANWFRNSSFFIEDGSFIRLQNVSLGYNIPIGSSKLIRSARVYVSGQNLFIMTDYTGYDPEVNNLGQEGTALGDDYDAYPRPRVYTVGVDLKF